MASIVLADAYYCVPVSETFKIFMAHFTNGLACCPHIFAKLFKPEYSILRQQQHESVSYIDDAYINGPSYKQCKTNIITTVCLFEALGFIICPEE